MAPLSFGRYPNPLPLGMTYTVYLNILPHEAILDPAGKATLHGLQGLGFTGFSSVRIGKRIQLTIDAANEAEVRALAEDAARKLLCNLITEQFTVDAVVPVGVN
jgi:phosphoribosylformylglycinamidine synthase subunit PurS